MGFQAGTRDALRGYNDPAVRRDREWTLRIGYALGVSVALGVVTFALVYLTTFSYAAGF